MLLKKYLLVGGFITATAITLQAKKIFNHGRVQPKVITEPSKQKNTPKVQVAILLDVSGSMDGLIDQAKAQLWNMVQTMGKLRADSHSLAPKIDIALYEYGRSSNDVNKGYIKLLNNFGAGLDDVSQTLFSLTTNGGEEYCGEVITQAVSTLAWDADKNVYKVIFIAGNEDFLQGRIQFTEACTLAKEKNIIVNTIYCGDRLQGIKEHWNLGGECGNGSYTNINQNAVMQEIPTVYDDPIFTLNRKLNDTYLAYGANGSAKIMTQASVDEKSYHSNVSSALKRAEVKADKNLYKNDQWDLVDATIADSNFYKKVALDKLPAPMQNLSREELKNLINKNLKERKIIQQEILALSKKRSLFLQEHKAKNKTSGEKTLQTEIENIIKSQAKRFKLTVL